MPHCIIEYAKPLENQIAVAELVKELFDGMVNSGLFNRSSIKVRALPSDYFMTGSDKQLYIHTTIKLLPGRSTEQKEKLGKALLDIKTQAFGDITMLSVEVVDLKESYFK
ncbi:5-carboxymethyl-2-hydroxymuconate Delta-isomerase [Kiloniella sp.]|uniref:5-carboxymethyl-2-hydroxymuconate Delta-isomerase n=1 Tax=Kiloniella sp. TaxID=1938587 RepID=UPI003A94D1CA